MTVIGEAFVEVRPESDQFDQEVAAQVAPPPIEVPVEPEEGLDAAVAAEVDAAAPDPIDVPLAPEDGLAAEVDAEVDAAASAVDVITVPVVPEVEGDAAANVQSELQGSAVAAGASYGGAFGDASGAALLARAKTFAGPVAAALSLKAGIDELRSVEEVGAGTRQVIRGLGEEAHITVGEVEDLASSTQELAAIDAELVQEAENLALRLFPAIRNEAGEGNRVFDRLVRTGADLSVTLGTDITGSVRVLGRALQDPVAGMAALSRLGIRFTDEQKEQIKVLHESGRTLEAQKMILRELEGRVGGAAKAYGETLGGDLDKAQIALEDLAGSIARILRPAIEGAAHLAEDLAGGVENILEVAHDVTGFLKRNSGSLFENNEPTDLVHDLLSQVKRDLDEGKISAKEADAVLEDFASTLRVAAADGAEHAAEQLEAFYKATGKLPPALGGVRSAVDSVAAGVDDALPNLKAIADAHERAADKARDQHLAELALVDGFLGVRGAQLDVADSSDALAEARDNLRKIVEEEGRGTEEYHDALRDVRRAELDAVTSSASLAAQVAAYVKEQTGAKASTRETVAEVERLADKMGLSDRQTGRLVGSVQALIDKERALPEGHSLDVRAPGLSTVVNLFNQWLDLSAQLEGSLNRVNDNLGKI